MVAIFSIAVGRLLGRFGTTRVAIAAFACLAVAYAVFRRAALR